MKNYKRVTCADGFSISIQAGNGKYSVPRFDSAMGFTQVELGYPNRPCPFIYKYAEDKADYTETVYPYVPAKVVVAMIKGHGGIVSGECPPLDLD
jgi:hypothetical protein